MPLVTGDVIQAQVVMSIFGQRVRLTRNYLFEGAGLPGQTVGEALEQCQDLFFDNGATDILDQVRAVLPTNVSVDETTTQLISPTRSVKVYRTQGVGGLFVGNATTVNVAGTITFRTPLAGRSQISTIHVGPLAAEQIDQGRIVPGTIILLAALGDVLDQVIDGALFIGGELQPVIWSPVFGARRITSHSVGGTVRTMRRRTVGIGE